MPYRRQCICECDASKASLCLKTTLGLHMKILMHFYCFLPNCNGLLVVKVLWFVSSLYFLSLAPILSCPWSKGITLTQSSGSKTMRESSFFSLSVHSRVIPKEVAFLFSDWGASKGPRTRSHCRGFRSQGDNQYGIKLPSYILYIA